MRIRSLPRDGRHAVRLLCTSPAFTIVAVLTLALGIGANTAIFTLVNALLLRPLPYRDSQNLVLVTSLDRADRDRIGCLTYPRYSLIAADRHALVGLAGFTSDTGNLTGSGDAEQVQVGRVSWNFFHVLGVTPALGRAFVRADEDGASAVVIGDSLWHRVLGGRRDAAGQTITLDGRPRTVVGVLPSDFTFGLLGGVEVWLPRIDELSLATTEQLRGGTCYLNAVGRLDDKVGLSAAQARMDVLNRRYAREFGGLPDSDPGRRVPVERLRDVLVAGTGPMLLTLTSAVAVVLLVACANVAGLLLARGLARRSELGVRAALGATRAELVRQLLTESAVLGVAGGLAGLAMSVLATRWLAATVAGVLPRGDEIVAGVDVRVLGFAAATSLLASIVFGLSPALQFSKTNLVALTKGDGGATGGGRQPMVVRRAIVVAQIALTVVLLISAGLLVRTFSRLSAIAPGFNATGLLTMNLSLPRAGYAASPQMINFYQRLLERVQSLPGVQSASLASALPINPSRASPVLVEGQPVVPLAERPIVSIQMLLGPYFGTMGIALVRGRVFDERDVAGGPPVVIVNQAFVRKFFGNGNPIGRHVTLGRRAIPAEIVGVVGDIRNQALTSDPAPEIEVPFTQLAWASMNLVVRTAGDPSTAIRSVRGAIASADADLPATRVRTMDDLLAAGRSRPKVVMRLLLLFAGSALALAVIGQYGLIAYAVNRRTHELAMRLALGARPHDLIGLVVRQGLGLSVAGVAVGLAAAFLVTRLMASQLYGVDPIDPLAFTLGPVLLLALAAIASWIPARRIARVDPSISLRAQ